jgi:hypothetical protein
MVSDLMADGLFKCVFGCTWSIRPSCERFVLGDSNLNFT